MYNKLAFKTLTRCLRVMQLKCERHTSRGMYVYNYVYKYNMSPLTRLRDRLTLSSYALTSMYTYILLFVIYNNRLCALCKRVHTRTCVSVELVKMRREETKKYCPCRKKYKFTRFSRP